LRRKEPFFVPEDQFGSGAMPASVPIQRKALGVMHVLRFCAAPAIDCDSNQPFCSEVSYW
jgi:hypothetical protein